LNASSCWQAEGQCSGACENCRNGLIWTFQTALLDNLGRKNIGAMLARSSRTPWEHPDRYLDRGALTATSGLVVAARMYETHQCQPADPRSVRLPHTEEVPAHAKPRRD
jgi:hypothetical protein